MAHIIITTDEPRSLTMLPHQTNQWHLFILFTFIWYFFYYGRIGIIFTMIVELSEKKHYVHIVYLNCSLFTDKIIFFFTFYPYSTFAPSRLMKLIIKNLAFNGFRINTTEYKTWKKCQSFNRTTSRICEAWNTFALKKRA